MKKFSKIQKIVSPNKIKFNFCIVLIFLLFSISFVLADIAPTKTSITVKIYENTIEFISEYGELNNWTETFNIIEYFNNSEIPSNGSVKEYSKTFDFVFIKEDTIENIDFYEEWKSCEIYSAKLDTGYSICVVDLAEYEGENSTTNKEELDTCNLRNQEKDLLIGNKDTQILDLEEEEKDTENVKFFWGIGGALLMLFGCLFYFGKIGKGFVKDKSVEEQSRTQQA